MRKLDEILARHTDRSRPLTEEATAVVRKAIEAMAISEFADSAVFLGDTPSTPPRLQRPEWKAGEGEHEDHLELKSGRAAAPGADDPPCPPTLGADLE